MTRPPWWDASWRAWLYAVAWLGGGLFLTGVGIWLVRIIAHGEWLENTQPQRLGVLGNALYMALSVPILVMIGLGLRNAIRNLKGSVGIASFEANGRDDPAHNSSVVTTTKTEIVE